MNRLTQLSFTAAPAALLAGWLLMRPTGADVVGGPWWTATYVACLAGYLMFGVMTVGLRRLAGPVRGWRRVAVEAAAGVALLGLAATVARLGIGLYAGFAGEPVAAGADFAFAPGAGLAGGPGAGFEAVVYGIPAQAFFGALVALAVVLAALGRVTVVSVAVTALGMVVLAAAMFGAGAATALIAGMLGTGAEKALAVGVFGTGAEAALAAVGLALMWLGTLLLGRGGRAARVPYRTGGDGGPARSVRA
ncbi:hypothetical protein FH608_010910 [Nonomuraea phyllanthi]|uniref:Uncharacterized protein n=1 Tax=Nonomuraea phyllanthi TaxID=2219224 RepID=A0A5C4WR26_9ACTN|nr:hypothetical protein [Nonomuraea phyllanthi]KAB8195976.1 hypothetical protein FH608_010910 [Nonomuraea phyllanthi]